MTPAVSAACPFELMLRADQHFDIVVAGEMFEDQSVASLELFLPLVDAIAAGRVIQRHTESSADRRQPRGRDTRLARRRLTVVQDAGFARRPTPIAADEAA